jgi:predicted nucleotidyltransferase component of viral defense system
MEAVLKSLINRYSCQTTQDYQNALKEIMQDVALLGLWRAKFFEHAAFYGGTALRILYGLDRFSEDLDFTLLQKNNDFNFSFYEQGLKNELASFGLTVNINQKVKTRVSSIQSAFLKANTKEHIIKIGAPKSLASVFQEQEVITIKLEIDTEPSAGFNVQSHDLFVPIPFSIRTLSLPSLFAGKMHAVLCRSWGSCVKGRDWYDMLWFIQQNIPLNLSYLEHKMRQTEHYNDAGPLTSEKLKQFLEFKIEQLDIERAKEDVYRFIKDMRFLDGWSKGIFCSAIQKIKYISN